MYYGPKPLAQLSAGLTLLHKTAATFTAAPAAASFKPVVQTANQILFANYDMVQSEIRWIRNTTGYSPDKQPVIDLFNNYFGGGMGAIVFQTIRESKALAYSTFASFVTPDKKEDPYFTVAYVGSQADKFNEAVVSMNELLNELPKLEQNLAFSKDGIKKDIETERITQDAIITNYLNNQRKGINYDMRKNIYTAVDKLTVNDVAAFHKQYIAGKPYTYCIVASDKKVSEEAMKKFGEVKKLSLEELFGF